MDEKNDKKSEESVWTALSLAGELGYMIALPIALLGFGGAYLDKMYATAHWFLFVGVVLAILVSSVAVYRKVKSIEK